MGGPSGHLLSTNKQGLCLDSCLIIRRQVQLLVQQRTAKEYLSRASLQASSARGADTDHGRWPSSHPPLPCQARPQTTHPLAAGHLLSDQVTPRCPCTSHPPSPQFDNPTIATQTKPATSSSPCPCCTRRRQLSCRVRAADAILSVPHDTPPAQRTEPKAAAAEPGSRRGREAL